MAKKSKKPMPAATVMDAAESLVRLARLRMPDQESPVTLGEIVDAGAEWEDPEPFIRSLVWADAGAITLERLVGIVRGLVSPQNREKTTAVTAREDLKRIAHDLGEQLLDHRDADRLHRDAIVAITTLVQRLDSVDERWDVVLPIVNLRLGIRGRAIRIGPVLLVRDPIDRFLWREDNEGDLAEFGQWALHRFGRDGGAFRGTLERVSAYAKVAGVEVGSSRVDLQACKLEYSIVSPK